MALIVCLGGGGRRRQFHILQYFCSPFPWVSLACVLWEITVSASVSHFVSFSFGMERSKVALKTDSLASTTPHEPLSKLHQKYCCCYQMLLLCYQTGYVPNPHLLQTLYFDGNRQHDLSLSVRTRRQYFSGCQCLTFSRTTEDARVTCNRAIQSRSHSPRSPQSSSMAHLLICALGYQVRSQSAPDLGPKPRP